MLGSGLAQQAGQLGDVRRDPPRLSVLRVMSLVFVRDYLRWARPWVHVAKAAISQRVWIARLKSAVLAVPVHFTFAVYYCAPGSIAKSSAGRSPKRCRRCKSSDTKYQLRRGFQHDEDGFMYVFK
jgi:hypothetical protein